MTIITSTPTVIRPTERHWRAQCATARRFETLVWTQENEDDGLNGFWTTTDPFAVKAMRSLGADIS